MGEHFLERQCLLKCAERSVKEHSARRDRDQQLSESRSNRIMVQPEHTDADTTPSKADHDTSRSDSKTSVIHEKQIQTTCPRVQNAPSSSFYCSPGLQEIFDRWPSMSEQPCPPANTAQVLHASAEAKRKRGSEHAAACESDSHQERLSGHEAGDATERPGSANDLIPPTQERPPVTPRVKLTTSSVQSPVAAPPLKQSTPSALLQPKPAVTQRLKSQPGQRENLSEEQADVAPDSDHKHQELNPCCAPSSSPRDLPSDVESPVADNGFTLQLSQDASLCSSGSFAIIDVASDRRLFETFITEWKTKERYCLALACEKREPRQQPDGEIGNSNIFTFSNLSKTVKIIPTSMYVCLVQRQRRTRGFTEWMVSQ